MGTVMIVLAWMTVGVLACAMLLMLALIVVTVVEAFRR